MDQTGVVLHVNNMVYLNAHDLVKACGRVLKTPVEEQEVEAKVEEFRELQEIRSQFEKKALRRADMALWGSAGLLGGWWGFTAYGTWWLWSWDVMEPVTYMVTYSVVCLGYIYFLTTKTEYTFTGLRTRISRRSHRKMLEREPGFDHEKYQELEQWMRANGIVVMESGEAMKKDKLGFDPDEILRVFNEYDRDGSGELSQSEWRKVAEEISNAQGNHPAASGSNSLRAATASMVLGKHS